MSDLCWTEVDMLSEEDDVEDDNIPKERLMEEVNATGGDGARFIDLLFVLPSSSILTICCCCCLLLLLLLLLFEGGGMKAVLSIIERRAV